MHDISFLEIFRITIERKCNESGEFLMDVDYAVAAMVPASNGDTFRV